MQTRIYKDGKYRVIDMLYPADSVALPSVSGLRYKCQRELICGLAEGSPQHLRWLMGPQQYEVACKANTLPVASYLVLKDKSKSDAKKALTYLGRVLSVSMQTMAPITSKVNEVAAELSLTIEGSGDRVLQYAHCYDEFDGYDIDADAYMRREVLWNRMDRRKVSHDYSAVRIAVDTAIPFYASEESLIYRAAVTRALMDVCIRTRRNVIVDALSVLKYPAFGCRLVFRRPVFGVRGRVVPSAMVSWLLASLASVRAWVLPWTASGEVLEALLECSKASVRSLSSPGKYRSIYMQCGYVNKQLPDKIMTEYDYLVGDDVNNRKSAIEACKVFAERVM